MAASAITARAAIAAVTARGHNGCEYRLFFDNDPAVATSTAVPTFVTDSIAPAPAVAAVTAVTAASAATAFGIPAVTASGTPAIYQHNLGDRTWIKQNSASAVTASGKAAIRASTVTTVAAIAARPASTIPAFTAATAFAARNHNRGRGCLGHGASFSFSFSDTENPSSATVRSVRAA